MKHPNVSLTADGKTDVYRHGEVKDDVATISLYHDFTAECAEIEVSDTSFELLSEEDLQIQFNLIQEDKNNEII